MKQLHMVHDIFKGFMLTRSELEGRLRWYGKKYGPYIQDRGLQNWKNLFRRPNMYEWTILFMLLMALFIGWAYQRDITMCRAVLEDLPNVCTQFTIQSNQSITSMSYQDWSISNITIKEENSEDEEVT